MIKNPIYNSTLDSEKSEQVNEYQVVRQTIYNTDTLHHS